MTVTKTMMVPVFRRLLRQHQQHQQHQQHLPLLLSSRTLAAFHKTKTCVHCFTTSTSTTTAEGAAAAAVNGGSLGHHHHHHYIHDSSLQHRRRSHCSFSSSYSTSLSSLPHIIKPHHLNSQTSHNPNLSITHTSFSTSSSSSSSSSPVVLDALHATALSHPRKSLLFDSSHISYTASSLLSRATRLAKHLPNHAPVAVFLPADGTFVTSLLAAWQVNVPAVPLSPLFPAAALRPLLKTVTPSVIITSQALRHALPTTSVPILSIDDIDLDDDGDEDGGMINHRNGSIDDMGKYALIFFTSGTTGAPKGVPWTHDMLAYQLSTLSTAWKWTRHDHIVNVLPLHHIHGLVNIVLSALYNSASLEMHSAFDAHSVWSSFTRRPPSPITSLSSSSSSPPRPTLFMAVPSIYQRLMQRYHDTAVLSDRDRRHMKDATSAMRLFVCGSAALSRADFDKWLDISGHAILERYGMTETGMTLSNGYHNRKRGFLGAPLPGVETQVDGNGQLLVKGPGVFQGYWNDEERTRGAFTSEGFFETGDIVEYVEDVGYYRLLGRANADFVKSGGYRVSTLEVEDVIREAHGVRDCTVIGIPDQRLGERIVVAIVPKHTNDDGNVDGGDDGNNERRRGHKQQQKKKVGQQQREQVLSYGHGADLQQQQQLWLDGIKVHAMERLPKYKVPRDFLIVDDLPRNVLGKVQKQMLRARLLS